MSLQKAPRPGGNGLELFDLFPKQITQIRQDCKWYIKIKILDCCRLFYEYKTMEYKFYKQEGNDFYYSAIFILTYELLLRKVKTLTT